MKTKLNRLELIQVFKSSGPVYHKNDWYYGINVDYFKGDIVGKFIIIHDLKLNRSYGNYLESLAKIDKEIIKGKGRLVYLFPVTCFAEGGNIIKKLQFQEKQRRLC